MKLVKMDDLKGLVDTGDMTFTGYDPEAQKYIDSTMPQPRLTVDSRSSRKNKQWNGMVASFVDGEDILPFQLLYSLQQKRPWGSFAGFVLSNIVRSDEVMVWTRDDEAIICLVGQNIATDSKHLIDDLNVVGATTNEMCQLRLARLGNELVQKLSQKYLITLCGYSLGGTAVACLSDQPSVMRGIIFNGGAPPSNAARPVPQNCTVYHIVGDILSTHFTEAKRVYLLETNYFRQQTETELQTDGVQWTDVAYYHSLDRFMDYGSPWQFVSAQFEQNSLENFFFFRPGDLFDVLGTVAGAISVQFNFKRKIQLQICNNPIPGSQPSRGCSEGGPNEADKLAGKVIGGGVGAIASLLGTGGVGVVPGVVGGAAAGEALASQEKGILDLINPEFGKTVVDTSQKVVEGISALDQLNNQKGKFTGTVVTNQSDRNAFGGSGLVVKPFLK